MIVTKIGGVKRVISMFDRRSKALGRAFVRGAKKAGLALQRESQKVVPVDTGNLKNSATTRVDDSNKGFDAQVTVGYTANYAVYVHENLTARHAPGKTAKFLEGPAREMRAEIANIIEAEIRKA